MEAQPHAAVLLHTIGLHFMAWDMMRDQYRCECGRQYLSAEQISSNWR
jgi:hypothetical protein